MHALIANATFDVLANGDEVQVAGAKDICFCFINCDTAKIQGKDLVDDDYADITGCTFIDMAGAAKQLSLTDCRLNFLKVVTTGTGDVTQCIRTGLRDYANDFPPATQVQVNDPVLA